MKSPEETIQERNSTHGDFHDNADTSQALKLIMHSAPNWERLSAVQKEALEVIALKISRVLSGNMSEPEHFHDIAGYAVLAEKYLREGTTALARKAQPSKLTNLVGLGEK